MMQHETAKTSGSAYQDVIDDLDAVVSESARAVHAIIDAAARLEQSLDAGEATDRSVLEAATREIYEACGFHDLTGQRIDRIKQTLAMIETGAGGASRHLSGPAKPGAVSQEDVDAVLADQEGDTC